MIVLVIHGIPHSACDALPLLIKELQSGVSKELQISAKEIAVFFPADLRALGLGEEIVCFVNGYLGLKELKTLHVLQALRNKLMSWARNYKYCQMAQTVVVIWGDMHIDSDE